MIIEEQFRQLESQAESFFPVVAKRYGYASFVAYVLKINNGPDKPSSWFVFEVNENQQFVSFKECCRY